MRQKEGVKECNGFGVSIIVKEIRVRSVPGKRIVVGGVGMSSWSKGNWNGCEEMIFREIVEMMFGGGRTGGQDCEASDAGKMVRWKVFDKGFENRGVVRK